MRIGYKLILVGVLLLLLLVPLAMLDGLVDERQARGEEVAADIARSSAGPQDLVGPLLLVEARQLTEKRRVVSRDALLQHVWNVDVSVNTRTVDTHASRIRRKLSLDGSHGWQLTAVYQHGYRLEHT